MRVSAQYAQDHFADLAGAADRGEEVEIERLGKPRLRLVVDAGDHAMPQPRKRLIGAAKGQIWFAEDWDSVETNRETAAAFKASVLFPDVIAR